MDWLWTWGGKFFGYKDGLDLWTYTGKHVGKFYVNEVYGENGQYLGELLYGRLIISVKKKNYVRGPFIPYRKRYYTSYYVDHVRRPMLKSHEDFPILK